MGKLVAGFLLFLAGFLLLRRSGARWAAEGGQPLVRRYLGRTGPAFAVALLATACLHSSSAFLTLLLGLAESGAIPTVAALAATLGANVGTTATALLASLPVPRRALFFTGTLFFVAGARFRRFRWLWIRAGRSGAGKCSSLADFGLLLLGLGILLAGLDLLAAQAASLTEWKPFADLLAVSGNPALGVLGGAVSSAVLQSSTLLVSLLTGLLRSGKLVLEDAVAIVVGANIGTTADVLVASALARPEARRVAFGHLLINVLGAGAFLVCPNILTRPLAGQNPARALAYAHTLFNLGGLLLWPLLPNLAGLLERVSKGEERQR